MGRSGGWGRRRVDAVAAGGRKSTYTGQTGTCVEFAEDDDRIAVRNSNHPDAGTVYLTPIGMAAFPEGVKAGEFGHLA